MRVAYSSQTQAHLGSDAEYNAIKSSGGRSWHAHTHSKKPKNTMTMSITRWCTVDPRSPSWACSCMCETEQKGSERPQIRTSLQLIRNYCRASKSVSWNNLPNILQERNTWLKLPLPNTIHACSTFLTLTFMMPFLPFSRLQRFFFSCLFLSLFCALTRHES